jgi:hypothetical protein
MPQPLAHPTSRFDPAPLVELSDEPTRQRLGGGALRFFLRLVATWKLREEDARALLGGVSRSTWHAIKSNSAERSLDQDTLTRISYLVGITKALNILHGETLADRWVTLPNSNPIFAGATPLTFMVRGGIPAMAVVRRLLDARRGGA